MENWQKYELNTLIKQQDVVVDCTDNVTIREQLNRLCLTLKRPLVSGTDSHGRTTGGIN
ncbi:MAG: ThiF family adenylyltransferase [Candidatus Arsenophonus phytopathogenicus]